MTSNDNTQVSFADVEEAKPLETNTDRSSFNDKADLTQSAREWDIDGDGKLNETELALKAIDKSKRGTLTKDQMYTLMTENLKTQRELFKVKKVVAGLVAFTCILALSNLGTSFAAAFLAKDTKVEEGKLADLDGKAVATDSTVNIMVGEEKLREEVLNQRRLACETIHGFDLTFDSCVAQSHSQVEIVFSEAVGDALINACDAGNHVSIRKLYNSGRDHVDHSICPATDLSRRGNSLTITDNGKTITIAREKVSKGTNVYVASGDGLPKSSIAQACDTTDNCGPNLVCERNTCLGVNHHPCNVGTGHNCAPNHDCLETVFREAPDTSPTATGECTCLNDDACEDGLVCRDSCLVPDFGIGCVSQAQLDQECVDFGPGLGSTCGSYTEGTASQCIFTEATATTATANPACPEDMSCSPSTDCDFVCQCEYGSESFGQCDAGNCSCAVPGRPANM